MLKGAGTMLLLGNIILSGAGSMSLILETKWTYVLLMWIVLGSGELVVASFESVAGDLVVDGLHGKFVYDSWLLK